ncbi:MAG TPA: DUF1801 domain-containing protein [Trueperaceae bacterium]|nr:DUF1801 domain-containing protein [Trueperaceae bacterium]
MAAKKDAALKLVPTDTPIEEFLAGIENGRRRADAEALVSLLREVTGEEPVVWTYGIVGFGDHHYRHSSGREGDVGRIGFAPRKANLVLYGFNSAPGSEELLQRLGKHRQGASCVYVNKLADVDLDVLRELAALGYRHMSSTTDSFVPR